MTTVSGMRAGGGGKGSGGSDDPLGFSAVLPQPGKKKAGDGRTIFRESRLVVLPDMQGLGIGPRVSDTVAELYLRWGHRFTSK